MVLNNSAIDSVRIQRGPRLGRPSVRILLHVDSDARLLEQVAGILEQAVVTHPDSFDKVKDEPGTVDHYGFHTPTLSATVLVKEPWGTFYRLTIRPGEHEVFDHLAALITDALGAAQ